MSFNAVQIVQKLLTELFSPTQFLYILQQEDTFDPHDLIKKVLTNRSLFQVHSTHFFLYNIQFDYKHFGKPLLIVFNKLIHLQFKRKNFFLETISQNYTLKYSNSSLDTLIESNTPRDDVTRLVIQQYRLHTPLVIHKTIQYIQQLQKQFHSEHALSPHFKSLLSSSSS